MIRTAASITTTASRWRFALAAALGLALVATGVPADAQAGTGSATDPAGSVVGEPAESDDHVRTAAAEERARRLLVLWEPGVTESARADVLGSIGSRAVPSGALDTVTVPAARADELPALARRLASRDDVAAAEVDREVRLAQQADGETSPLAPRPDDPLFRDQWGLENTGQLLLADGTRSLIGADVRAREAWAITEGDPSVTVAVIDAGIDIGHPDLTGAIWTNAGEVANGADSDGNGFVDDRNGYDFITDQPIIAATPTTEQQGVGESHGTQVAGVIAARSRDGFGVAGVAPQVSIMPIRAFAQATSGSAGSSDINTIVRSINYAVDGGADVINASWESPSSSTVLLRTVADAGIPVVAAAGNGGNALEVNGPAVPATYQLPNLVAVTAIDPAGQRPFFANYGPETIDLAAPGQAIVTTDIGGGHRRLENGAASGTSFAVPFVSGALALGVSAEPTTPVADLLDTLLRTTTPRASFAGFTTSGGSLDIGAFLLGLQRPVCGRDLLPVAGFADVEVASTHARAIDCIADADVTRGYADGTYRPVETVTRGQLATFLASIVATADATPEEVPDAFTDDDGTTHERAINVLAALDVLQGDAQGRVDANAPVTRGQLASLLVRTHAVLDGVEREPSRAWFPDTAATTHEAEIAIARDLGLVRGRDRVRFEPTEVSRRDQMASTLARMLDSLGREGVALALGTAAG